MDFGIGPFGCRRPPGSSEGMSPIYERSIRLAERAEAAGFDSAWVAEHHFAADGYLPSPTSVAAAIASRTGGLEVGTGLAVAPVHEPLSLAEDAAVLDLLARNGGGRFTLGLGLGYRDVEFDAFGVSRRERVGWLLDTVETCREAWSDGPLDVDGRLVDYPPVDVTPKPGSDVRILLGANSTPGIERAARTADGYVAPPGYSPDELDAKLAPARAILDESGADPGEFDVYHMQYASVHPDGREAAWEAVREEYLYTRKAYLEYFVESSDSDLDMSEAEIDASVERFEDRWRSDLVHGSPDEVADRLGEYGDCWDGTVHAILQLQYPGLSPDIAERAVELVGEEVVPRLADV